MLRDLGVFYFMYFLVQVEWRTMCDSGCSIGRTMFEYNSMFDLYHHTETSYDTRSQTKTGSCMSQAKEPAESADHQTKNQRG